MNRTEFIAAITDRLNSESEDWSKSDVKTVLETFEEIVTEECAAGGFVNLTGFVKFARVDRAARMGRNPATGETIKIKAKSVAKVTPLKKFKDAVLASSAKKKTKK